MLNLYLRHIPGGCIYETIIIEYVRKRDTNGVVVVVSSAVNITQHIQLSLQTYMIEDVEATEMILDLT